MVQKISIEVLEFGVPHVDGRGALKRRPHRLKVTGLQSEPMFVDLNPSVAPKEYKRAIKKLYPDAKIRITGAKTEVETFHQSVAFRDTDIIVAFTPRPIEVYTKRKLTIFTIKPKKLVPTHFTKAMNWIARKMVEFQQW